MAGFSIARVPYYITVTVYMAFVAFVSYINNTVSQGIESDFFLAVLLLSIGLCVASVIYMVRSQNGEDDEVAIAVAGLPFGKTYYYLAILGVCAWRGFEGYGMNHTGTGIASTWGLVWIVASAAVALFTWANYKSFQAKTPTA